MTSGVGDALGGLGQQPAYPVEGAVLGASPAGGLVLHSAAHVVNRRVRKPDHMQQPRDWTGAGQRVGDGHAVRV